jgi:hypothetical protein
VTRQLFIANSDSTSRSGGTQIDLKCKRGVTTVLQWKLQTAVSAVELTNDCAGLHIQIGKQRRRALRSREPNVLLNRDAWETAAACGSRLGSDFFHRRATQCGIWRVDIEANNVAHFIDEQRVFGELECFAAMRLQGEGPPDATYRAPAQARFFRK